jgi:hypothetical protein
VEHYTELRTRGKVGLMDLIDSRGKNGNSFHGHPMLRPDLLVDTGVVGWVVGYGHSPAALPCSSWPRTRCIS